MLNKQGDNIQPWHTSFPILNQSVVPYPVLTVSSWHAYRFLRRQVRWSGIPISLRVFQFVVIHAVKGFGSVNKAEMFFWNSLLVKAMVFPVDMYGCESWTVKKAERWRIDTLNCGVGEDCWESLGLQGAPTSPFWRRSALGFLLREWCWSWNSSTLATSCEELTHWKRLWCWEGLGAEEKGMTKDEMAGWHHWLDGHEFEWTPGVGDGTGRPFLLPFMGSQRVGHDWVTVLNCLTDWCSIDSGGDYYTCSHKTFLIRVKRRKKKGGEKEQRD